MLKKQSLLKNSVILLVMLLLHLCCPEFRFLYVFFVDIVRGEVLILNSRILYISLQLSWGGDVFL